NKRIVATGSLCDVRARIGSNVDEVDLKGRTAVPGFYDAHAHIMGVGFAAAEIDLTPDAVSSIEEIASLVKERAASQPAGSWVLGRGYDQAMLAEGRIPTRHDIDAVSPDHPVILRRMCHHIVTANSKALELAGITRNSPDPDDGTIDRDEHGEPTGEIGRASCREKCRSRGWAEHEEQKARTS